MRKDRLKRKLVAREYIQNGFDLEKALKKINNGKELVGRGYSVQASRWRKDPEFFNDVRKELARFDKSILNDTYLLSNLLDIATDTNIKPADRVNSMALMAKLLKLTDDSSNKQVNVSVFADQLKQVKPDIVVKSEPIVDNSSIHKFDDSSIINASLCTTVSYDNIV